jgi:hypothetical protein
MIDMKIGTSLDTFFRLETHFFYFTTLIQLPIAHLKITFSKFLKLKKKKLSYMVPFKRSKKSSKKKFEKRPKVKKNVIL